MRRETAAWRADGLAQAVVPTMGALHEGHLTPGARGPEAAPRVVVTIFVNPRQFGAKRIWAAIPATRRAMWQSSGSAGAHLIFAPPLGNLSGETLPPPVNVAGPAKAGLEDKFRPHFFDGVATVVAKLFIQTGADFAMFGEKDYQQLQVVTRMARDLDIAIEVVGIADRPRSRRPRDVVAQPISSADERQQATAIYQALQQAAEKIRQGTDLPRRPARDRRSLTTLASRSTT